MEELIYELMELTTDESLGAPVGELTKTLERIRAIAIEMYSTMG